MTFICSKSLVKTPEKGLKYVQSKQYKHQNDVIDVTFTFKSIDITASFYGFDWPFD